MKTGTRKREENSKKMEPKVLFTEAEEGLIRSPDCSPMRPACNRPIAVFKLALEAGDGDGAERPAVARVVTIVSHYEAIIFGYGDGPIQLPPCRRQRRRPV